jgi:hypothetical protein
MGLGRLDSILGSYTQFQESIFFHHNPSKNIGSDPLPPPLCRWHGEQRRQFIVFLRNFYFHEV